MINLSADQCENPSLSVGESSERERVACNNDGRRHAVYIKPLNVCKESPKNKPFTFMIH